MNAAEAQALLRKLDQELAQSLLIEFIKYTYPGYQVGWFHRSVCEELDAFLAAVQAKQSPRLMLLAPPRSGKSEIVSRRFPAHALGKDPDLTVIAASYGADLASAMNRDVQRVIDQPEYKELFPETALFADNVRTVAQGSWLRNSDIFEIVNHKGVYRSAGVGGGITGRGGHICIVDDPIKDAEQADSPVYRQKVWEWYTSTLYTRLAPGGGILLIQTRWHEDDLAGRLLDAQKKGDGDKWKVVSYPAIAEVDEKYRKAGEALHPERYPLESFIGADGNGGIRKAVGGRVWASLYQQRPAAAEGGILKRAWWKYYRPTSFDPQTLVRELGITSVVQVWDTAFKEKAQNDPSACMTFGIAPNKYFILDVWCQKVEYPDLKRAAMALHAKWKPHAVLVEDKASGQSLIQELKRETVMPVLPVPVDRDKVARANAISPMLEAGLVYVPEGPEATWVSDFIDECASFPNAAHDDQVDTLTMALDYARKNQGGLGMLEWMRQEAERIALERQGKARLPA